MEFKEELELLLNHFIITKDGNREAYYRIKSKIKKLREFTTTKLGCDIIINSSLIKLEKIPSQIDNTFRLEEFDRRRKYVLLVLVIMFLEDKARDEQFIMSYLTTFITNTLATIEHREVVIDFNDFSTRKSLVDVLKYLISLGAIRLIDGNDNLFKDSSLQEVLYENTGISRYLIRQFKEDIFGYEKPEDFLNTIDLEEMKNKRRYYTYRSLLFYPSFRYSDFDLEVYQYFMNYRNRVMADIGDLLDGELLIYNDVALLTTTEKKSRLVFPNSRKVIHDIILLVNDYLARELQDLEVSRLELERLFTRIYDDNFQNFSKEFRDMKKNRFFEVIVDMMEKCGFVRVKEDGYLFSPIIYLISGNYPEEEEEVKLEAYDQMQIMMEE